MTHWVWSDDPVDWAQQLTAVFTVLAATFTGIYVWLTYRLMVSTALAARVAVVETQRGRIARLLPLVRVLETIGDALRAIGKDPTTERVARIAGLVAEERLRLASCVESAMYLFEDRNHITMEAQRSVEETNKRVMEVLTNRSDQTRL
jgi:hypothetical protein